MSFNKRSTAESRFDPSLVTKIRYVILSNEAGVFIPPLTCNVTGSQSLRAAHIESISNIAYQLEESRSIPLGTGIAIDIPTILDKHILIVGPPALPDNDPTMFVVYVYALKLDGNIAVTSSDIMSVLKQVNSSSPFFQSLGSAYYGLEVYRRGNSNNVEILKSLESDEYSVGAILCLTESNNDEAPPSSTLHVRGNASREYHIGSQCVAVLPSTDPMLFQDSGMNEESVNLQEERKDREDDEAVTWNGGGVVKHCALVEENESEAYHTLMEEETRKQENELIVTHMSNANTEGGMVLPAMSQNPTNNDKTELSSSVRTPSYTPMVPLSATDSKIVYNTPSLEVQKKHHYQPSISPPINRSPCNQTVSTVGKRNQFPSTVKGLNHGSILYRKEFLKRIVPSGNFSHLPKCEELDRYPLIGEGGNGCVIRFYLSGYEVALKYMKAPSNYRAEILEIWSELSHTNIVPLLGAFVVHSLVGYHCCQLMPKMTSSLRREIELIGDGILPAIRANQVNEGVVWCNFRKICRSTLSALDYLGERGTTLMDLKSSNLLVYRFCKCRSILECGPCCTYSVELSDFDFVRRCSKVYRRCTLHPVKRKSHEELVHFIDGTPGYRAAPEKYWETCNCEGVNIIGPWIDVWAFGVLLIDELRGRADKCSIISEAKMLSGNIGDNASRFNPNTFDIVAELNSVLLKWIKLLRNEFCSNETVGEVLEMIDACLKADCSERATPSMLLDLLFFRH